MARPREFDEAKVLAAAVDTFWTRGYGATSTRELTECTGLTPASMYNAFGDKRGLFLCALGQYFEAELRTRISRLETSHPGGHAIAAWFAEVIERSLADRKHRGCLLVNSALETTAEDPELQRIVANEMAMLEGFFRRCIVAGQSTGAIAPHHHADDVARLLLSTSLGLRILARVRPDRELLTGIVRPVLQMLALEPPASPKVKTGRAPTGKAGIRRRTNRKPHAA